MRTRVLLAVDMPSVLHELQMLLQRELGIELVGEVNGIGCVLKMVKALPVDVVVMDINMAPLCRVGTARRILAAVPNIKVVQVSFQSDFRYVRENLRAGVSGYVLEDCAYEELPQAIKTVAGNGRYLSPEIEIGIP